MLCMLGLGYGEFLLGFEGHHMVSVNGLDIETLHPGPPHNLGLRMDMLQLLLTLFPHKDMLGDFGAMLHPRIRLKDLDLFEAT